MPTQGLSLVGYLDQNAAINHLKGSCVVADPSDAALIVEWQAARAKLGAPTPNAGKPDIQPLPADGQAHVAQLVKQPWVQNGPWVQLLQGAAFNLVEIEPLLAFQLTVDVDRSNHHGNGVQQQPTLSEMLALCLPQTQATEEVRFWTSPGSMMITSRSLNVQPLAHGLLGPSVVGMAFGVILPFVHVVRFNGRSYLHNGFHRAVALRRRGATHVPCVFRDVPDEQSVGIRIDGGTFGLPLLESANPPTLAHFTQDRAYNVQLKIVSRTLHVSWAQYATSIE